MYGNLVAGFRLPRQHRRDFSKPRGIVVRGDLTKRLERAEEPITCVGDVVSSFCNRLSRDHIVLVIDGKTRRTHETSIEVNGYRRLEVFNPPGFLTLNAIRSICLAEANPAHWLLLVKGEEDMIALAALACMPERGTLVYGVPSIGATIIRATAGTVREAQSRFLLLRPVLYEAGDKVNNTL